MNANHINWVNLVGIKNGSTGVHIHPLKHIELTLSPLDSKGSYSATSNNNAAPPSPLLAVPNVTAHPSMASVPITVLLCDGPLLCGFLCGD